MRLLRKEIDSLSIESLVADLSYYKLKIANGVPLSRLDITQLQYKASVYGSSDVFYYAVGMEELLFQSFEEFLIDAPQIIGDTSDVTTITPGHEYIVHYAKMKLPFVVKSMIVPEITVIMNSAVMEELRQILKTQTEDK